jgi:hypothetical protein
MLLFYLKMMLEFLVFCVSMIAVMAFVSFVLG